MFVGEHKKKKKKKPTPSLYSPLSLPLAIAIT
jgi:hypothetical protein